MRRRQPSEPDMTTAINAADATVTEIAAGGFHLVADTTPPHGAGAGFRPHQLLEAALASCMAITLRMVATERGIALKTAAVSVELDRSREAETVFRTTVDLDGDLSDGDRRLLLAAVERCPVRRTLSRQLVFPAATAA
ncbi:OsmC-like protein [bacterium YEK0313]|nr:OsmC-like protein [bacterium YEK0313]